MEYFSNIAAGIFLYSMFNGVKQTAINQSTITILYSILTAITLLGAVCFFLLRTPVLTTAGANLQQQAEASNQIAEQEEVDDSQCKLKFKTKKANKQTKTNTAFQF